jgi:hypothetical protein
MPRLALDRAALGRVARFCQTFIRWALVIDNVTQRSPGEQVADSEAGRTLGHRYRGTPAVTSAHLVSI